MKRPTSKKAVFAIACCLLLAVVAYNGIRMASNKKAMARPPVAATQAPPNVAVVTVEPASYQAQIEGVGSAEATYQLTLNSRISGQVDTLNHQFDSGYVVKKGTQLVTLDKSQWLAELASAKQTAAEAEVSYLQEQQEAQQAQEEWSKSGLTGEPLSPLVLREPQLKAAKTVLESAQQAVVAAQTNLNSAQVKAPFDAIVVSRSVSPGSYVQAGSELGELLSAEQLNIRIALSASDWALFDETTLLNEKTSVTLNDVSTQQQWQGFISRVEKHSPTETRQRAIIVSVENPLAQTPALYPGTFVKATINGKTIDNLWRLPASALSQRGDIWLVDADQQLAAHRANIQFAKDQYLYVSPPEGYQQAQVVLQPLNSYKAGTRVNPQEEQ